MDIISGLSDELLLKILSFVPTKVAVSTSILSKRWEYLWMWLPKLEYRSIYRSRSEYKRLAGFLNRNIPLHKAPIIESFFLQLYNPHFKPDNINMWVAIVVCHCLRELEIIYEYEPTNKSIVLPSNLYTCKSLVVLKLDGGILLDVPRMVSLPSLKTLKLQGVKYFNDETLQRLLSNCPVLDDLVLDLREYDTTGKLSVVVPSLQSLSLFIPDAHEIDGIVIETPALKYFKLVDYNNHYCLIEKMPYLIEAHLDVELHEISSLIGSITSVKHLAICSQTTFDEGFVFNQLEHLEVCLCMGHPCTQLVRLLKASSNLKRLDISFMHGHEYPLSMDDWNQPSTVPECMLSSLQILNWSSYTGEPQERDIAVYILEHSVHLKTATITPDESDITELEMLKELSRSSRASTTCQLVFE